MKRNIVVVVIVLLTVCGVYFVLRKPGNQQVTQSKPTSTQSISSRVEAAGGQLIDVRTAEEYTESHAQGATNVPLATIQGGDLSKIDKNKAVYLYCRSGNRAGQAKTLLEQAGYKNVTNLGGLSDWENQGGKVCKSSGSSC